MQESGKNKGHVRVSHAGSPRLRVILYRPVPISIMHNPAVRTLALYLRERGKTDKQPPYTAMRKLLHNAYGVLKSGEPFGPKRALAHRYLQQQTLRLLRRSVGCNR